MEEEEMKKFLAALMILVLALSGVCAVAEEEVKVMTYAEYAAAAIDDEVVVECYVQAHQSWWDNKVTVYAADEDGAYFIYEMACSEEDAAKLVPGTKILVKGFKGEWAGEVEIMDATFEFVDGEAYIAEAKDLTEVLATEELVNYQNQLAAFKGLTIESIAYKNGEPGDDIYVTVKQGEKTFDFCVERYLTGPETEVYAAFAELKAGDVVDVTGFVYWYNGVNTHITAVEKAGAAMTYADYAAAAIDDEVVVECYVQAHQSWWDNKVTVYAADEDGAYFIYEMACSEEDAAKLVPGTKILVKGFKGEWAGEVEIMDATFEFVDGEAYIAEAKDLTEVLATEELVNYQNQLAAFKGLTIESIAYKNGEPGDDIYVTVKQGEKTFDFCVERYLTGPETEVYAAFAELKAGDVVDVTGFVYWYNGVNTHITAVAKAQ